MADSKISGLPASTTPLAGTETLPVVQGGVTKQVSVADLTAGRSVSVADLTSAGNIFIPDGSGVLNNLYYSGGWKYAGNGYGLAIYFDGSGHYVINTAPLNSSGAGAAATVTEVARIDLDGSFSTKGNLVIGTSGKGIDFSPTSDAAGMTSELLDDYEEGTFTATMLFGGANSGMSYNAQGGWYTKIGDTVHFTIFIQMGLKGTSTGAVTVTGLPFVPKNTTSRRYSINTTAQSLTGLTGAPFSVLNENDATLYVYQTDATGGTALTDAVFTQYSSDNLIITGTYQA